MTKLMGKKKLTVVLVAIFILLAVTLCGAFDHRLTASAAAAEQDKTGLGYSINAATSAYLDVENIRDGSPVFDTAWLKTQLANANKLTINSTNTYSYNTSSFEDMAKAASASLGFSNSVKGSYDIFTAGTENGLKIYGGIDYTNMVSQYYYTHNCDIKRYSYSLPNYSSDLSAYKNNLNSVYLSNLGKLFNGSMSYEHFFDIYGTHVIAKGIYGGKLNLYYSVISNQLDVGASLATKITSGLNAGIKGLGTASASVKFNLNTAINYKSGQKNESFKVLAEGGNPFTIANIGQFSQYYANWFNSVSSSPSLIGTSSDGLIPLWKLLPNEYAAYESKFLSEYNKYVKGINDNLYKSYKPSNNDFKSVVTIDTGIIRSNTYRITDSGRFNQPCDVINLTDKFKYSAQILKSNGYKKVKVLVKFQMREINYGYQYCMLYKNKTDDVIQESDTFEYGGTSLKQTFGNVEFLFDNLSIDNFTTYEQLVIRYGASGSGEDDWENRNLSVYMEFSK